MTDRRIAQPSIARADARIVVKVGSSSISGANAGQIAPTRRRARRGARAAAPRSSWCPPAPSPPGMPVPASSMGRPTDLATQQAAAAVGQNVLIFRYQESLDRYRIVAGQVLLTAGDLENPTHRSNAQRAMERLLGLRILPIVNENDTVATHEIRFGDNDRLAALVAQLVRADVLVLLSRRRRPLHEAAAGAGRAAHPQRAVRRRPRRRANSARPAQPASAPGER